MEGIVRPDRHSFRMTIRVVVHLLRMLTFSCTNPHIAKGWLLTPEDIVDVVLHGVLKKES
jgi:hypothetical protein